MQLYIYFNFPSKNQIPYFSKTTSNLISIVSLTSILPTEQGFELYQKTKEINLFISVIMFYVRDIENLKTFSLICASLCCIHHLTKLFKHYFLKLKDHLFIIGFLIVITKASSICCSCVRLIKIRK